MMVEVTQADREAAWPAWSWAVLDTPPTITIKAHYDEGDEDESVIVQAFAAHRIASTTALQAELIAKDARIAELSIELQIWKLAVANHKAASDPDSPFHAKEPTQ
jgi:hypothetical protein